MLSDKIERAFDYRGDVTLDLADGRAVTGFVFNRNADGNTDHPDGYVEMYRTDDGERLVFGYGELRDVRFTGEDHFQPWTPPEPEDGAGR